MDFEFQPWERLSDEVTDGEAHMRGEREGVEWLFRACGHLWFSRRAGDVGREGNRVFCPVVGKHNRWDVRLATSYLEDEGPVEVLRDFPDEDLKSAWFRVWRLNADTTGSHFVAWNENTGWFYGNEPFFLVGRDSSWPFRFVSPSVSSSSFLFNALQSEWQNFASELRFAAHFAALPELERALLGVETHLGTPREFVSMMRAAICSFAKENTVLLEFRSVGGGRRFVLRENHPLGARESAILNHIVRAFEPRQKPDSPDLPLCVRQFTEGGWTRGFEIEVARPSMHEQLEAALELRAWLQAHWPEGVKHLEKLV